MIKTTENVSEGYVRKVRHIVDIQEFDLLVLSICFEEKRKKC